MWKILSFFFVIFVAVALTVYWFFPLGTVEFSSKNASSNFTIGQIGEVNAQFYENLRFPSKEISYKIYDECTLKKKQDAEDAFSILSEKTTLEFFSVQINEEISVACQDDKKDHGRFFVAGEGGPVNITSTENFNVISYGKILLIEESKCSVPNVAIHEILHALGFDHSANPNNVMYNVTKCSQEIGEDTTNLINEIYSYKSLSDLTFENVSAVMHGKYLDAEINIRNHGLKESGNFNLEIYADDKLVKEQEIENLKTGFGITFQFTNIFVNKITVSNIIFKINSDFEELDKSNNELALEIKN